MPVLCVWQEFHNPITRAASWQKDPWLWHIPQDGPWTNNGSTWTTEAKPLIQACLHLKRAAWWV